MASPSHWADGRLPSCVYREKFGNLPVIPYENQGSYCNLYLSFFSIMSKSDNGAAFPQHQTPLERFLPVSGTLGSNRP